MILSSGCGVWGIGFRVQDSRFRVSGSRIGDQGRK
jgi:hypothetical protein